MENTSYSSPPPTEIELRAQERYKITSQCRAWIPYGSPGGWSLILGSRTAPIFLEPTTWTINLILSGFGGQTCHSAQPSYKGGCTSKVIYHLPVQGQPLLMLCLSMVSQCPNQQHYGTVSKVALWWEEGLYYRRYDSFIHLLTLQTYSKYVPGTRQNSRC